MPPEAAEEPMKTIEYKGKVFASNIPDEPAAAVIKELQGLLEGKEGIHLMKRAAGGDKSADKRLHDIIKKHCAAAGCKAPVSTGGGKAGPKSAGKAGPKSAGKAGPKSAGKAGPKSAGKVPAPVPVSTKAPVRVPAPTPAPKKTKAPKAAKKAVDPRKPMLRARKKAEDLVGKRGKKSREKGVAALDALLHKYGDVLDAGEKKAIGSLKKQTEEALAQPATKKKKGTTKPAAKRVPLNATERAEKTAELDKKTNDLKGALAELRVACPGHPGNALAQAAAAVAAAEAMARNSAEVANARNAVTAALRALVGYESAKKAIAKAKHSAPALAAKAHHLEVVREQTAAADLAIVRAAEKDPRVIQAIADLEQARTPEAVETARKKLAELRAFCQGAERELHGLYGPDVKRLKAELKHGVLPATAGAETPAAPPKSAAEIMDEAMTGPKTTISAGSRPGSGQ
jgi:hypothetical protein